jgi:hypothetical protein
MIASRNPLFLCRTILSSVASFSPARSRIDASWLTCLSFRNRSYIRRNDRVEEGVFASLEVRGDDDLGRTIAANTLPGLNG